MGIITEILTGGALGGITGLIGSIGNRLLLHREKEQAHRHAIQMAEIEAGRDTQRFAHEVNLHQLNIEAAKGETERELLVSREAGSWKAMEVSQSAQAARKGDLKESQWVVDGKGAARPVLTFLLWLIVSVIFIFADGEGRTVIVAASVYCATAATLWWFADRAPAYKELVGGMLTRRVP